jgi:type VI secretion system secreted protein VgrG
MIDFNQFKEHVVVPTLEYLDSEIPYSEEAVDLLMMTCAHESRGGKYLRQKGMTGIEGAFGVYQMEMATHDDIYQNFLHFRKGLIFKIDDLCGTDGVIPQFDLTTNLAYATAMARVHYWRVAEALPSKDDTTYLDKLGDYAKAYYNTHLGKATSSKYVTDYWKWRDS